VTLKIWPQKPKALAWEIQRALNAEHRKKECHNERHLCCVEASNIAAKIMKLFVFQRNCLQHAEHDHTT